MTSHAGDREALDRILLQAREGKAKPVYAFVGERFFTQQAAKALIDVVLRPEDRTWNLERFEGQSVAWQRVIETLRTPGFGSSPKVVWVVDCMLAGNRRPPAVVFEEILGLWGADRKKPAAEALLALLAQAGWSDKDLHATTSPVLKPEEEVRLFGRQLQPEEQKELVQIVGYASSLGLSVSAFKSAEDELVGLLRSGLAPRVILLLTMGTVDEKSLLWKAINKVGHAVVFSVERERSQALSRTAMEKVVRIVLGRYGKTLTPAAFDLLARRGGNDVDILANEVEKACLWVGEREQIDVADVLSATSDLAESWVFDFCAALNRRNLADCLRKLDDLLLRGEPAARLVALVARELRQLVLAKECLQYDLEPRLGSKGRHFRLPSNYSVFQKSILPQIPKARLDEFGKVHPFVLFRRLQDAETWTLKELHAAVTELAQLDLTLKSSGSPTRTLFEAFIFRWCAEPRRQLSAPLPGS